MDGNQIVSLVSVICAAVSPIISAIFVNRMEFNSLEKKIDAELKAKCMDIEQENKKIVWESYKTALSSLLVSYKNLLMNSSKEISGSDRISLIVSAMNLQSFVPAESEQYQEIRSLLQLLTDEKEYQDAVGRGSILLQLKNLMLFIANDSLSSQKEMRPK